MKLSDLFEFNGNYNSLNVYTEMKVIEPKENQLFIDIDSEEQYKKYLNALKVLQSYSSIIVKKEETFSKSGFPNRHIILTLTEDYSDLERIALQFMLHSDFVRESLGTIKCVCGMDTPICFFEK